MGIKNFINRIGGKAADKVAKLSALSPEQLKDIEEKKQNYLREMPDMDDIGAELYTNKLLAACGIEIYNAYLPRIDDLYLPLVNEIEYDGEFRSAYNIRYFNITKWVSDKKENSLEKLVNVYEVLSNEECNIALIFHRGCNKTDVYLAVVNTRNAADNVDVNNYSIRLSDALRGNFPGVEFSETGIGRLPCLNNNYPYSVASATNVPAEKSEKFISQTIEKLLDGTIPENKRKEYTIILLATPIQDVAERKLRLTELYSGLAPYAGWQTNYTFTESSADTSMATFGVNVGASAGIQRGTSQSVNQSTTNTESQSEANTASQSDTETDSTSQSESVSQGQSQTLSESSSESQTSGETVSHSDSTNQSTTNTVGGSASVSVETEVKAGFGPIKAGESVTGQVGVEASHAATNGTGTTDSIAKNVAKTVAKSTSKAVTDSLVNTVSSQVGHATAKTVGSAVTKTLGKAVANTVGTTIGASKGINLGSNFGANFARASNVTATVGMNEGIVQSFTNYNIKHTLEILEEQMKRYEQSTALGMWDFAAYILSEDQNVASNVAHSYLALTQGEKSYVSNTSINLWRGDLGEESGDASEICKYLRDLRHPLFGLNPLIFEEDTSVSLYPSVVTATTSLSGKELAYSLNFPRKSIAGLPVIECAQFGRNIVKYDLDPAKGEDLSIGNIFHMHHREPEIVSLRKSSLASHVFITGSTGSGKSNTVYRILEEAVEKKTCFMVIEPAKGEYKNIVSGFEKKVDVYGTNPDLTDLLRINPFSFPKGIHVFEHLDRLVEIFNVCWPMYAAMPAVLKSAIEKSYEDCGWNLTESVNPFGEDLYPTFKDVARNIKTIIDTSEYDAENKGAYKGSLLTRLQSLTNGINGMIFTENAVPEEDLFEKNVIIDLSRVGSNETKSLLMGMLVLKLQEFRISHANGINVPLRHLTVLEEAHNLLKRTSTEQSSETANIAGKSVEMISNAIAEMRTYGEGFIIVDQAPGLLDMAAIRNTNTKIIMRLPDQEDRELVGRAANLNNDQIMEIAKLPCGVAAIYQNEWVQPVLCKVDKFEYDESVYQYEKPKADNKADRDTNNDRMYIAELLFSGTAIDREVVLKDVKARLNRLRIASSAKAAIMRHLLRPGHEIKMSKLAPMISDLYPEVLTEVRETYVETNEPSEWTYAAQDVLFKLYPDHLDDIPRRYIIQSVITQHLVNELKQLDEFARWREGNGLR